MNTEIKEKIKELESDLFWYNILLWVFGFANGLKITWTINKYGGKMPIDQMFWKIAIIIAVSFSFLIYFFIEERKLLRELKKLKKRINN